MQQEWVDKDFLASTHVGTPDPRQKDPPTGQRLLVGWRFPTNWLDWGIHLETTVRFWDNREEVIRYDLDSSHGSHAFNFFGQKILTYKVEVVDACGDVLEVWEHQFWTKLIDADRRSLSVSSQPMQPSVIETP